MTGPGGSLDQADTRIGQALAAEHVPDHGPDFWTALGTRLIAERDAPAAPTFDPLERLEQADRKPDIVGDEIPSGRRGRKRDLPEPAPELVRPAVSQLAEHAEWHKEVRPAWPRRLLAAAGAAALFVVLGMAIWLGGTAGPAHPRPTSRHLAEVMSRRLTGSAYVVGTQDTVGLGGSTGRYTFVRGSNGTMRSQGPDRRADSAYDTVSGSAQGWRLRAGETFEASADSGLAPGPPDADGVDHYRTADELGSMIRSLESAPVALARSREDQGRKEWVVDLHPATSRGAPVDGIQVVVDQHTQLPVEMSRSVNGTVIEHSRFRELRLVDRVTPDALRLVLAPTVIPPPFDNGFRRTGLSAAPGIVGYTPAVPGWLPTGFELATVAVLQGSPLGLPASAAGDNPPNRDVVSIAYRRGVDQLTVTMRRVDGLGDQWKDPFAGPASAGASGRVQRVRLEGGRFVGTVVEQVTAAGAAPHVWGRSADFVFTVAGDLEPSQVLRVANSLR